MSSNPLSEVSRKRRNFQLPITITLPSNLKANAGDVVSRRGMNASSVLQVQRVWEAGTLLSCVPLIRLCSKGSPGRKWYIFNKVPFMIKFDTRCELSLS